VLDRRLPGALSVVSGDVHDGRMDRVHKITSLDATWKPGDVVLDAKGDIRVRSEHPKWVWDYPNEGSTHDALGRLMVPEGALEEKDVARPLVLLIRDGKPIGGQLVEENELP
jgi:hypothetical protein